MKQNGKNRGSIQGNTHPYLRTSFWNNPENHFWERPLYTEKSKEYLRNLIAGVFRKHKNMATI